MGGGGGGAAGIHRCVGAWAVRVSSRLRRYTSTGSGVSAPTECSMRHTSNASCQQLQVSGGLLIDHGSKVVFHASQVPANLLKVEKSGGSSVFT